ncbi:MAG: aminotransferase class I/II-fold pyridoxal phosphate-dependent enzyme, partial [Bacillota bacterium]
MIVNFYERYQPKEQLGFIEDALLDGFLSTDGKYTDLLKEHFKQSSGIEEILFTPSATAALELAVQLLALQPGEEVLIPSYTFPSAASAVMKCGGTPVLCDVDLMTKNISLEDAASKITGKTKAMIPTHYAGISCDMNKLMELAGNHKLTVIEDAAQTVHSLYYDKPLGTIGNFGAYSFHYTKNFSCGEGGAFLCNDPSYLNHAEIIRDNGTNKAQFFKHKVSSYSWQCIGSNYMMSGACAALLYSQLLDYEAITAKRKAVSEIYHKILSESTEQLGDTISLMELPGYSTPNYHIYYINCKDYETREAIRRGLL